MGHITDFNSFSKALKRAQKRHECGFYPELTYNARSQLRNELSYIGFTSSDTVYILESFDPDDGALYQSIWTKTVKLEFKVKGRGQAQIVPSPFTERLYGMIEEWDIARVRMNEKDHGLLGGAEMIGTRIILRNGKAEVECFKFKEFFDLEQDQ